MTKLADVILRDDRASQPAAGDVPAGTLYYVTDEHVTERSNGSAWQDVTGSASLSIDDLTDVDTSTTPPTDGQVLAWDDTGGQWVPVDPSAGGADLSAFRLAGVADDPADIPLGTYGDEMEYADQTELEAVWTPRGSSTRLFASGSHAVLWTPSGTGRGLFVDASAFDADFEVGFLVSCLEYHGDMWGPALVDGSGNGFGMSPYNDGNSYFWTLSSYAYSATGSSTAGTYSAYSDGRPVWWFIRRDSSGPNYRLRYSEDGSTMNSLIASGVRSDSFSQIGFNRPFNNSASPSAMLLHRVVYGTPDLGL